MPCSNAFWNLSLAFREAADAAFAFTRAPNYSGLIVVPCVFLYFRSIELALKSILMFHGLSESEITRTLGHRVVDLLHRADCFQQFASVGLTEADRQLINDHSRAYSDKWFEYPNDPPAGYPDLDTLRELSHRLSDRTREYEHPKPLPGN